MDFFRNLAATSKSEFTNIADDGVSSAEYSGLIDTGCYMFNAQISGSLFGGMQNNKVLGICGPTSTGKTFFALGIIANFLSANPKAGVVYYDTESAVTKEMMINRGIDPKRVIIDEPQTIEQFRTQAINMIENYMKFPEKERPPMMFVLDSLGNLSSNKEMADVTAGSDTRDMTKAQLIRATFRVLRLKLAKAGIPFIVTNHTYAQIGSNTNEEELAGGGGFKYCSDTIALLSKAQDKIEATNEIVGNYITVKMYKARLSKEKTKTRLRLSYTTGLNKYYGLLDLAEKYKIFPKMSTQYEIDGKKYFGKTINDNPEKFFTPEILEKLELAAQKEFRYGDTEEDVVTVETTNEVQE